MRQYGTPWEFERVPGPEGTKPTRLSVLPHRESTLSSKRSSWDLSEVIDLPLHPQLLTRAVCALWGALEILSGSSVPSHTRAKTLEEHSIPSANISPCHQVVPLHLTNYKPGA